MVKLWEISNLTLVGWETRSRARRGVMNALNPNETFAPAGRMLSHQAVKTNSWLSHSIWPLAWEWGPEEGLPLAPSREQKAFHNWETSCLTPQLTGGPVHVLPIADASTLLYSAMLPWTVQWGKRISGLWKGAHTEIRRTGSFLCLLGMASAWQGERPAW